MPPEQKNGSPLVASFTGATCRRCFFFKPGRQADDAGECRKNVPHVLAMPGQGLAGNVGVHLQSYWPPVKPSEWCGEFNPQIGTA